MNKLLLLAPRLATNRLWARAGEVPSFHIAPAALGHARDLITGRVLGTYNSASPAMAVGPDGLLFTPAANAPVIEYNPVTRACLGARIWDVVTNRLLQSSDFATTWTQNNVIVSANAATAPDQTNTADQFSPTINGASSQRFLRQDFSTTANDTYTLSVFVKVNTATTNGIALVVQDQAAANNFRCNFNLFTLTTSPAALNWATPTASIIAYPNGWYRCSVTGVTSAAHTSLRNSIFLNTFGSVPDTVGSVFLWGAQLNTGPIAPYVPTTTLAASSTADVWSITGADFNRIYNQSAVTSFTSATGPDISSGQFPRVVQIDDGTDSNRVAITHSSGGTSFVVRVSGVTSSAFSGISLNNGPKLAFAAQSNDAAVSVNGASVLAFSPTAMPTTTTLWIGSATTGQSLNGYIREGAIFRSRRPNANLQAVTT